MLITRSSVMGFCFGVKRAVEKAETALSESGGQQVYALGSLIHNEAVMDYLVKKGLIVCNGAVDIPKIPKNSTVIVRAHGELLSNLNVLSEMGCTIIDGTCPRVKHSQNIVTEYSKQGYTILFCGDCLHAEVRAIKSCSCGDFILLQNEQDARNFLATFSQENTIFPNVDATPSQENATTSCKPVIPPIIAAASSHENATSSHENATFPNVDVSSSQAAAAPYQCIPIPNKAAAVFSQNRTITPQKDVASPQADAILSKCAAVPPQTNTAQPQDTTFFSKDSFTIPQENTASCKNNIIFPQVAMTSPQAATATPKNIASLSQAAMPSPKKKFLLMSQTTFGEEIFFKIADILQGLPCLVVKNTICDATKKRQDALVVLCGQVDCVIVIGSKKSSNTKRLLEIAKENCAAAYLVENEHDLQNIRLQGRIGITAGASTPDALIAKIASLIEKKI